MGPGARARSRSRSDGSSPVSSTWTGSAWTTFKGDIDGLVLFSEALKAYPVGPGTDFPDLAVSNDRLSRPHLLGTDTQGRDILSAIFYGLRASLSRPGRQGRR